MGIHVIIIGGEIGWNIEEDIFNVDAVTKSIPTLHKHREMLVKIKLYIPIQDEVRTYELRGAQGKICASNPDKVDYKVIEAHKLAKLLIDHDIDTTDLLKILRSAQWDYGMSNVVLAATITKMIERLEGGTV